MGLYYDKKKERWIVRIRRQSGSVTRTLGLGVTKSQAVEVLKRIERDLIDQENGTRVAIATVWERMIREEFPKLKRPENYRFTMRSLSGYCLGRNVEDLRDIATEVSLDGRWKVSTRNRLLQFLSRTNRLSNKWYGTPLIQISRAGMVEGREIYFTSEQVQRMVGRALELFKPEGLGSHLGRSIRIGAYTGLRQGEILALRADDIRGDIIHVRQSKTGRPRFVPFPEHIRTDLLAFIREEKRPRHWYTRNFRKVLKEMGLEGHFHDLRHTCASWLIAEGVDIYTVGKILGHTSVSTTQRYAHLSIDSLRTAMRKLG